MTNRERIVFQHPDGSLAIVNPVEPIQPPESVEAWLDRIAARAVAASIPRPKENEPEWEYLVRINSLKVTGEILAGYTRIATLDVADFPATRRFRNAWRYDGNGKVRTAPVAATAMILTEVREDRDLALKTSDSERMRLEDVGTKEQKQALAAYRQLLRDLPAVVEAELANLPIADLETFKPSLPAKPS